MSGVFRHGRGPHLRATSLIAIAQMALFGAGTSGRDRLFDHRLLAAYLSDPGTDHVPHVDDRIEQCRIWVENLRSVRKTTTKAQELQLEGAFARLWADLLGYQAYPADEANLWAKPSPQFTGLSGTPDLTLGNFSDRANPRFRVVVELKSPGTDLDRPQQGRADRFSPVEQAFDYGKRLLVVRWVVVSDMQTVRLYSIDDPYSYMHFDLAAVRDATSFGRMWWLLSAHALVGDGEDSMVNNLLAKSTEQRIALSNGFYEAYSTIRQDLFQAIGAGVSAAGIPRSRDELLQDTQRLLDRMLFLYYCEDHPQQLIDHGTVAATTELASRRLGAHPGKVYEELKLLFREVDKGSPEASSANLPAFNGELFKSHDVLDVIELPDALHRKQYTVNVGGRDTRVIKGVWGLHKFDFWEDLNEHMLGKVFEESLSDLVELRSGQPVNLAAKMHERRKSGIYYTVDLLANFATEPALMAVLDRRAIELATTDETDPADPKIRLRALQSLRIADLTCGSGAFVVSAYRIVLREFHRLMEARGDMVGSPDLFSQHERTTQASLLRQCLYGFDLLPQAVEIAKLALWLLSARRDEKVPDLSSNFAAVDSLDLENALAKVHLRPGDLDLVIGNPPWGGQMAPTSYAAACSFLGVDPSRELDSWELFLLLGIHALRPGGRLAFVLPDSLLYEQKARTRHWLLENTTVLRLHSLGPGWFGPKVRMSTVVLDVMNEPTALANDLTAMLLAGRWRKDAQAGRLPLSQIEAQRSRQIPQDRCLNEPLARIEVFRGRRDDVILDMIKRNSENLTAICNRGRGEEMNKAGRYWECPSCAMPTVPGKTAKGGGYEPKACMACGALLDQTMVRVRRLVEYAPAVPGTWCPYLDGEDIARRYQSVVPTKRLRLGLSSWTYKNETLYAGEKLLIRQAGVGLFVALDRSGARCPQSVYIYRLKPERIDAGWTHEFVLAALLSRTMAYVLFKQFGEIDPDKAHAKVTHTRLASLPIPKLSLDSPAHRKTVTAITELVRQILSGEESLGGAADWAIERELRSLWGLSGDDGAYINGEFADLPTGQALRDLFPDGPPMLRGAAASPVL